MPTRLMLIARAKLASACGPSLPTTFSPCTMPAQLTRPCRPPKPSTAAATAACALASSVTSVRTKRTAAAELGGERVALGLLEIGDDDAPPPSTEHPHRRGAEARRAAGDDEDAVGDLHR